MDFLENSFIIPQRIIIIIFREMGIHLYKGLDENSYGQSFPSNWVGRISLKPNR